MALERDKGREMFPGKTQMHACMREFDWGASCFGQPDSWPKSLRAIVDLMLDSAFPMCLAWGPDFRLLYNDACLTIAGPRHPAAFGAPMQDACSELWSALEPIVKQALAGQPGLFENFPVDVVRYGRPARRWFNFSCTHFHDDAARIAGVVCIGNETTEQVLMERHHAFQLRLSDQLRSLSDPDEITAHSSRLLGLHLGVSRVGYVDVDEVSKTVRARPDWTNGELPSLIGRTMTMNDFNAASIAQLRAGRIVKVNDSAADGDSAAPSSIASNGARSTLVIPLFKSGELCALLHVNGTHAHLWMEDEVALAEAAAERTWDAVERANAQERRRLAEEELQRSAARQAFQLELSDLLRPMTDPDAIIAAASGLLGSHLGVSRVLYAEVDDAKGTFEVRRDWTRTGVTSVGGRVSRLDDFGPEVIAALRSGSAVSSEDIAHDPRTAPHARAYASVGVRAFVVLPLVKSGRLSIALILHHNQPFHWKELDLQRAQDMAERTWSSVEAARALVALRAERDRSQHVLDSMTEGFAMVGPDCTLLQMNAEGGRISRLSQAQAVGRKVTEIWPDAASSGLGALYRGVRETGQAGYLEFKRTLPDGQPSWLEIRAYPALDGSTAVFYRDINERKEAEKKLQEADRRKDEFVATLAHELRNPIAPIAAAAGVLALPNLDAADVKRAGEIILRQVGHMAGLVNELLDISRIAKGLVDLHPGPVDINEIVPEAVEQAQPLIGSHEHHLELHLADDPAPVWGDRKRLVQVLVNLLNNAAKYTPNGGSIVLQVRAEDDYVVASVRDNGIGMAPELVESAFELFAQAERTPDRTQGGLGIGLALVKGIVELHGGTVTAHSAGIGHGSEFRVLLPRLPGNAGPAASPG
ncbi:MAG TPA: ATP-binding protein [Ramlibacter sp.]|nr:ATP-binding protein [Ramlibacter sp.]